MSEHRAQKGVQSEIQCWTHDKQYVKQDEQFIRIALRIILTLFFISNQEKLINKLHVCIVMSLNMISQTDWMISERWTNDESAR